MAVNFFEPRPRIFALASWAMTQAVTPADDAQTGRRALAATDSLSANPAAPPLIRQSERAADRVTNFLGESQRIRACFGVATQRARAPAGADRLHLGLAVVGLGRDVPLCCTRRASGRWLGIPIPLPLSARVIPARSGRGRQSAAAHSRIHRQSPSIPATEAMWSLQTQSLPTGPLPTIKRQHWDEPALLSDDETDSESERGGDTLSSEDQQLLAAFIRLNRERKMQALKQRELARPAAQTSPVLIPTHAHRCYEPSSEEMWEIEDDEDECPSGNECSVCWRKDMQRFSSKHSPPAAVQQPPQDQPIWEADPSDLLFDLEL
jgi:hypothetical protein